MNAYEAYMNELSKQMREELTTHGFNSLESADAVTNYMQQAVSYTHLRAHET